MPTTPLSGQQSTQTIARYYIMRSWMKAALWIVSIIKCKCQYHPYPYNFNGYGYYGSYQPPPPAPPHNPQPHAGSGAGHLGSRGHPPPQVRRPPPNPDPRQPLPPPFHLLSLLTLPPPLPPPPSRGEPFHLPSTSNQRRGCEGARGTVLGWKQPTAGRGLSWLPRGVRRRAAGRGLPLLPVAKPASVAHVRWRQGQARDLPGWGGHEGPLPSRRGLHRGPPLRPGWLLLQKHTFACPFHRGRLEME